MEYPFIMAEVNKAIASQKKETFPDGMAGQMLKLSVKNAYMQILAEQRKYGKQDNINEIRAAAIANIAALFIFIHEIEKQTK